jgi:hypothetical protein
LPGTSPFTKSSLEGQPPVADDIWLKETWKLGEVCSCVILLFTHVQSVGRT